MLQRSAPCLVVLALVLAGCSDPDLNVQEAPIKILSDVPGTGWAAEPGDLVTISYRALLPDGSELLSASSYQFELGADAVIIGVDEAVTGMQVQGRRVVKCPPHKHWGAKAYAGGAVPADTPLTLQIELLAIE
ncbi:MAG: FKBP-type peptidyl-prolyl cis-trans isomerase [Planctomycetota bacterium]|jgi:peptidylprolyl isomerase